MPEYLAPGVYVEEVDSGAKPIEGVSTSTTGMVGVTERGPVGEPTLITSFPQYTRVFGGRLDPEEYPNSWYLPYAVEAFFNNGGKRVYVVRVVPSPSASKAEGDLYEREDQAYSTKLAAIAPKDEAFVLVEDHAHITDGTHLLIDDGVASEYFEVTGDPTTGEAMIGLTTPVIAFQAAQTDVVGFTLADDAVPVDRHPAAAIAPGATTFVLDDITGLAPAGGELLQIGADADAAREWIVTSTIDTVTKTVTSRTPLANAHAATTPLIRHKLTTEVGRTPLAHPLAPGARIAIVEDAATLGGSTVVGFGNTPSEYHLFSPDLAVFGVPPSIDRHAAGAEVVIPTLTDAGARQLDAAAARGDREITLSQRSDLRGTPLPNPILRLTDQNGVNEYVLIDDIVGAPGAGNDPGVVKLKTQLRQDYLNAAAVHAYVDAAADASATTLGRGANATERAIVLEDGSAYSAGTLIRIEPAASARVEYHEVTEDVGVVPLDGPLANAHPVGADVVQRVPAVHVEALDPGRWGNDVHVIAQEETAPVLDTTPAATAAGMPTVPLQSVVGIEPGTVLEFYRPRTNGTPEQTVFRQKVETVAGNAVALSGGVVQDVTGDMRVRTQDFKLTVEAIRTNPRTKKDEVVEGMAETFPHLSLDPRHTRYVTSVIGQVPTTTTETVGESDLVRVADLRSSATAESDLGKIDVLRMNGHFIGLPLEQGTDSIGSVIDDTYIGDDSVDPSERTGLHALKNIEEIAMVAIPGRTSQKVQEALITHCELMRYRFAVIDSVKTKKLDDVEQQRSLYDTKYAALYYPWFTIDDPYPVNPQQPGELAIPPSGHILGIYARSDNTRGVHKAPANEVVREIKGLYVELVKEQQDILNPRGINVVRDFRDHGRGIRVWGARCATSDSDWKYVNVRRLFIFLEHSLDNGTQWAVFEPNDERLWARVRQSVSSFLTAVWRDGALMGSKPEEAFFVKCDHTTMTQYDIDNGRLIVKIGVAPVKPAEFVIVRIGQWAGGSSVEEL
jgi:Bacteriophage tail sheath protein